VHTPSRDPVLSAPDDPMTTTATPVYAPERARRPAPPALSRLRVLGRHPGALAMTVYVALSFFADFPIWPGDPSAFPTEAGGDIVQTAWFLEWTPYALLHGLNPFFTNFINYPHGVNIAQNTGIQLLAIVSAPLTLLVNPIASENLLRFLAFPLSAYAAYFVLRHWTRFAPAAFVGGLLYGFSPYMVTQGEYHLNLMFVPFPPLIIWALYELLVSRREAAWRAGLRLGLFCVLQFYISSEVLATTALVCAPALLFLALLHYREVPKRAVHALFGFATALAVLLPLVAYPLYEMLRGPAHYTGPAQGFNNVYNADLFGAVLPTHNMAFAPARLSGIAMKLVAAQVQENGSYLGVPLIVITLYLMLRYWRRLWPLYAGLVALTAFVLSLGPRLIADGHAQLLPFQLPFAKIAHLPLVENILPVRLSLYTAFFVAVIVALGIDAYHDELLARRGPRRSRWRALTPARLAMALLALACGITLVPRWPYKVLPVRVGVHYSETAKGLSSIPVGSTVLAYPYPTSFFDMAMLWQSLDDMRFRLLGSYALVPRRSGTATIFPEVLQPEQVEAMLVNSVTVVADPTLPDLVATKTSITASRVIFIPPGVDPDSVHATLIGKVGGVDYTHHRFYLYKNTFTPTAVDYSATTSFVDAAVASPGPQHLHLRDEVAVVGTVGPGTVTPALVRGLRSYLQLHHVTAVILGLGITDAAEIANWLRAAIGKPTRAGGGAMIWNDVTSRVAHPPPTPTAPAPPAVQSALG